jgi:sporulation protein YlmC with PRC-barrel domain
MEDFMPTTSGHTSAILASKVKGTAVFDTTGDKVGHVEDVVLDKLSNGIMFAAVGFGGIMGMGEKYAPVPWSVLDYSEDKNGYVVPMTKEELAKAPAYDLKDLVQGDGQAGKVRDMSFDYFKVPRSVH